MEGADRPMLSGDGDNPLASDEEGSPARVPRTHKTLLGTNVIDDAEGWHYVMVFNRATSASQPMRKAAEVLQDCVTPRMLEPWSQEEPSFFDKVQEGRITRGEFYDAIWSRTLQVLSGRACGFRLGFKPSLDGSSTLLYIALSSRETVDQLADRIGMKIRVTPLSYAVKGITCPEVAPTLEQRVGLVKAPQKFAPVYLKYESSRKEGFRAAAADRIQKAEETIDDIAREWSCSSLGCKARVRRLMRLDDMRAAALAVMVHRLESARFSKELEIAEAVAHAQAPAPRSRFAFIGGCFGSEAKEHGLFQTYREMFEEMNVFLERHNVDLEHEVQSCASEHERFHVRFARWSPPRFPDLEGYKSANLYDEITHLDILRLVKRRLAQFVNVALLEKHGIIDGFFPPHCTSEIHRLTERWASLHPGDLIQWPGNQHDDMVRNYFGEEVAFFFDWLSYMTRMLMFPAFLSLVSGATIEYMEEDSRRSLRNAFSVLMCAWVAHLTASYDQVTTTRNIIWGMAGYSDRGMVRPQYEPRLRGSFRERAIRLAHWLMVVAFVGQTIWAAEVIAVFRHDALQNPSGSVLLPLGLHLSNKAAADLGVYAVTANINIMSIVWDRISPIISDRENWRTDQTLKNHQVTKTFFVKCVVYYYPFFYLAFVRDFVEGCQGRECLHELRVNLAVFIITHIVTVIGNVVYQVGLSWYTEYALKRRVAKELNLSQYSYVQAQAHRPPYAGDTADYMELSIVLGFISMFSVVYPFLAFLAFISNLLEMRILAFRMCRVLRRPVPRGQEGIGAWLTVMKFLTYLSCVTCVALCIFVLKPLKELDMEAKLGGFVITEHAMLALAYLVGQAIPSKSVSAELITENNDEAAERIVGGDDREVHATSGRVECLQPGTEGMLPGVEPR